MARTFRRSLAAANLAPEIPVSNSIPQVQYISGIADYLLNMSELLPN